MSCAQVIRFIQVGAFANREQRCSSEFVVMLSSLFRSSLCGVLTSHQLLPLEFLIEKNLGQEKTTRIVVYEKHFQPDLKFMCEFHSVTSRAELYCETSMKFSDKKLSCFSIERELNSTVIERIGLQGFRRSGGHGKHVGYCFQKITFP